MSSTSLNFKSGPLLMVSRYFWVHQVKTLRKKIFTRFLSRPQPHCDLSGPPLSIWACPKSPRRERGDVTMAPPPPNSYSIEEVGNDLEEEEEEEGDCDKSGMNGKPR